MSNRKIRRQVDQAKKKLKVAGKKVDHVIDVVNGFNYLVEKKAVAFEENTVYLYQDLWGSDPVRLKSWMENAYIYMRMKLGFEKGKTVYFKDIETDEVIGMYPET